MDSEAAAQELEEIPDGLVLDMNADTSNQHNSIGSILPNDQPKKESPAVSSTPLVRRPGYKFCEDHQQEYLQYCCGCALEATRVLERIRERVTPNDQAQTPPP